MRTPFFSFLLYDGARVHGFSMTRALLEKVVRDLAGMPLEERKSVPGLDPGPGRDVLGVTGAV